MEKCIFCGYTKLYTLQTGHRKCARCKKKLSPRKYEKTDKLLKLYVKHKSAQEAARRSDYGYPGVYQKYAAFRKAAALWEQNKEFGRVIQYDEHFYLPKTPRKQSSRIYEAKNILVFARENGIDTQLLPFEQKYPRGLYDPGVLKNFIRNHRIARLQSYENEITRFVRFFEAHLRTYRGVHGDNFVYYLKEAQFFYNHDSGQRVEILRGLMKYLV